VETHFHSVHLSWTTRPSWRSHCAPSNY